MSKRFVKLLPDMIEIHIATLYPEDGSPITIYVPDAIWGMTDGEPLSLTIDYPLTNSVTLSVPFSHYVNDMIGDICNKYRDIYAEEEATLSHYEPQSPYLLNRPKSDGKYGIWGHVIGELWIKGLDLDLKKKELILHVGS